MFESFKVVTTRGETYVFSGRDGNIAPIFIGGFLHVRKNGIEVAIFPTQNVEGVLRIIDIDGGVAS